MDPLKLGSGDNQKTPRFAEESEGSGETKNIIPIKMPKEENPNEGVIISPEVIENNETKLKERIAQCKNIIESLKNELNKEKTKLNKESKDVEIPHVSEYVSPVHETILSDSVLGDLYPANMYSAFVDTKLNCDENVIEYEKQLQKYQNTLNMAQVEKKNAIRKQMLAKAFKLKLLEVENQCNIELLRVRQSLQCLEPLQMIANKWKMGSSSDSYDLNNYELIPRFPDLYASSGSDINSFREDFEMKPLDDNKISAKEDSPSNF